jgi:pimeloyl-ACP methyl ester carboxylesterase
MQFEAIQPRRGPENQTSFEKQFARREKIKVAGGAAETVDVSPENPPDKNPVFFAPSWGCTLEVYKPALETLVHQQRRVISLNHPRIGGSMKGVSADALSKYPKEELRKALNILDILEQKKIYKVDAISHSEGSINLIIAATLHPEKFRNIVLYAPAGLIGKDTLKRLASGHKKASSGRAPTLMPLIPPNPIEEKVGRASVTEGVKYIAKNPWRSFNEVKNISATQIENMLRSLHEKGIGIVIMSGVDDPVFPIENMQKIVKYNMIDGFLSLIGGHGEIGNNPEHFMVAAENMLTKSEEKKSGKKSL